MTTPATPAAGASAAESPDPPTDPTAAYRAAGVDIAAGDDLVTAIKPLAAATARPGSLGGLGGFAAAFDPRAAGFRDPILLAATDGVGTKLKLAFASGRHDTVGIDLVAMCVNDLLASGAEPLFFLDYYATGRLDRATATAVIAGIAAGCREAGCALIGGETAEMPGFYAPGDYDLAGFAVGAVERDGLLTGARVTAGDRVLGLAASGLHANGFSLVRRLIEEAGLTLADPAPFEPSATLGEALLRPTRLYVRAVLPEIRAGRIRAAAHITGGGLVENVPRVLPDGLGVRLDRRRWPVPPVMRWLASQGLDGRSLATTFNLGLGMVVVVGQADADRVAGALEAADERVFDIGEVAAIGDGPRVEIAALDPASWPA